MNPNAEAFHKELVALSKKHGLCAIPSYEGQPSAHDPMLIVPLDGDWEKYIETSVYEPHSEED